MPNQAHPPQKRKRDWSALVYITIVGGCVAFAALMMATVLQ